MFTRSDCVPASVNVRTSLFEMPGMPWLWRSDHLSSGLRDSIRAMLDASVGPSQVTSTGMPLLSTGFSRIFLGTS